MAKYQASYRGIGKMLRSEFMQEAMRKRAEAIKARAESIAPAETGEYKGSFEVETGVRKGRSGRAVATVRNTSDHALYVEYGTKRTPRYRVLGKAAQLGED